MFPPCYDRIEVPSATIETNDIFNVSTKTLCGEDCVLVIGNPPWATNSELSFNLPPKTNFKGLRGIEDFDKKSVIDTLIVSGDTVKTARTITDLEGKCQFVWRQGVKHDCGKVMELDRKDNDFINKNKTAVRLENGLVFPLVKSSHFKKPIIHDFSKFVIVTQTKPKQDTAYIQKEYPLTWKYLNDNIESFDKRKSVIYKETAPFSMFGIGDYSFAPYKVALSGFYKKPLFCLLYASKPVMTDDTAYFLAFYDYDIAYSMMLLLNSKTVQEFLLSIAFLDNKRPYTVKLLSRLDIQKCLEAVPFEGLKQTEAGLKLPPKITETMYRNLAQFVREQA